jgi:hypothetical protein
MHLTNVFAASAEAAYAGYASTRNVKIPEKVRNMPVPTNGLNLLVLPSTWVSIDVRFLVLTEDTANDWNYPMNRAVCRPAKPLKAYQQSWVDKCVVRVRETYEQSNRDKNPSCNSRRKS